MCSSMVILRVPFPVLNTWVLGLVFCNDPWRNGRRIHFDSTWGTGISPFDWPRWSAQEIRHGCWSYSYLEWRWWLASIGLEDRFQTKTFECSQDLYTTRTPNEMSTWGMDFFFCLKIFCGSDTSQLWSSCCEGCWTEYQMWPFSWLFLQDRMKVFAIRSKMCCWVKKIKAFVASSSLFFSMDHWQIQPQKTNQQIEGEPNPKKIRDFATGDRFHPAWSIIPTHLIQVGVFENWKETHPLWPVQTLGRPQGNRGSGQKAQAKSWKSWFEPWVRGNGTLSQAFCISSWLWGGQIFPKCPKKMGAAEVFFLVAGIILMTFWNQKTEEI